MCQQLDVSRTGRSQWVARDESDWSQANSALAWRALHPESDRHSRRPRLVQALVAEGSPAGHERVRHSLLRQGLQLVCRRPCLVTNDSDYDLPLIPRILDGRFDGWVPDRAWVVDITYLRT